MKCFAFCVLLLLPLSGRAQQNCPLPPPLQSTTAAENMFSDAQEVDLGDAMAEAIGLHLTVIQNDEITSHLQELGNRLVAHLPPTQLKFRFFLIDLPEVNAFAIAGGRVYVSRKIIAFSRNDDELAGILAHELGHIVTHQSAIEMTRAFREMGIAQVGNREDIFRRFHQFLEGVSRRQRRGRNQEEKHQIVADQVSVYALARAGFAVQAFPDFWDRFNQLHRQTGSWLSDLFGVTSPEQHRLREMIKNSGSLPAGCADRLPSSDAASFHAWQQAVIEYEIAQGTESIPGLIVRQKLSTRLRAEVSNLRFSRDGKYILAQDDGGIHVVKRDPFALLFYIPATDAREAQFSPDSSSVVFMTYGMRVEGWSIVSQKRTSVQELTIHSHCLESELSPDGKTVACVDSSNALLLIDVATSSVICEKKDFYKPSFSDLFAILLAAREPEEEDSPEELFHFVNLRFSPDGRYLMAGHRSMFGSLSTLLFDLVSRREQSLPGSIKDAIAINFDFVGADKIVGVNESTPQKSRVLKFPSGEKVGEVALGFGIHMRGATRGDFLIVGPMKEAPLGVLDIRTGKFVAAIRQHATDAYDELFVTERVNGELALHVPGTQEPVATVQLSESRLGRLVAGATSPDLKYLAVSTRSRGAVWDIGRDARLFHARRFNGISFAGANAYAQFPKFQDFPPSIGQLQLETGQAVQQRAFKDEIVAQHGNYLVTTRPHKGGAGFSDADVQVEDVRNGQVLWSRYFPASLPIMTFNSAANTALLRWKVFSPGAQQELKHLPELKKGAQKQDMLCEVVDADLGALIAYFIVNTNEGRLRFVRGSATREWAVMEATGDQVLTFALPSGEERGHLFGRQAALSTSGLLALSTGNREITVYDLATSEARQQYRFKDAVALKVFSQDGKRMLVFTNDQTVYIFDVTLAPAAEPSLASR